MNAIIYLRKTRIYWLLGGKSLRINLFFEKKIAFTGYWAVRAWGLIIYLKKLTFTGYWVVRIWGLFIY